MSNDNPILFKKQPAPHCGDPRNALHGPQRDGVLCADCRLVIATGLIKGSPAMGGVKVVGVSGRGISYQIGRFSSYHRPTKYEITEAGSQYIEKYSDYDPEPS